MSNMKILILLMFAPVICLSQSIPLSTNTIIVHRVTFKQILSKFLDSGYEIKAKDMDLQTAETKWEKSRAIEADLSRGQKFAAKKYKTSLDLSEVYYSIKVRVKEDSTAEYKIVLHYHENSYLHQKNCDDCLDAVFFDEVAQFAASLHAPISYANLP